MPYRNIWIREIPSVYANTTHGGPGVKAADVAQLRERTAAKLYEQVRARKGWILDAAIEILTYSKKPEYVALYRRAADDYVAAVSKWDDKTVLKNEKGLRTMARNFDVQVRHGVLDAADPLVVAVKSLVAKLPSAKR